jgi:hypothetical protein
MYHTISIYTAATSSQIFCSNSALVLVQFTYPLPLQDPQRKQSQADNSADVRSDLTWLSKKKWKCTLSVMERQVLNSPPHKIQYNTEKWFENTRVTQINPWTATNFKGWKFKSLCIIRRMHVQLSARSWHLSACDYFLWGYLNS